MEPEHMVESKGPGDLQNVKVLDTEVRRDIDLEFLEKAGKWMEEAKAQKRPFFIYFNHSNVALEGREVSAAPRARAPRLPGA